MPLLITLSIKIDFAAASQFPTQKTIDIFKSFWCIYFFYLKLVFEITTVHSDWGFSPVQEIIADILSGPMVNLMSANKHVPKIKQRIRGVKERFRATRHSLPCVRLPVILTINIV